MWHCASGRAGGSEVARRRGWRRIWAGIASVSADAVGGERDQQQAAVRVDVIGVDG